MSDAEFDDFLALLHSDGLIADEIIAGLSPQDLEALNARNAARRPPPGETEMEDVLGAFVGNLGWGAAADAALDYIPIVGQAKAGKELLTGRNVFGEEIGLTGRVLAGVSLIPGGALVKRLAGFGDAARGAAKATAAADDLADATRRLDPPKFEAPKVANDVLNEGGCFVAGTAVSVLTLPQSSRLAPAAGRFAPRVPRPAAGCANDSSSPSVDDPGSRPPQLTAIELVPLGARIAARNPRPEDYDFAWDEPEEATWAQLDLAIRRSDGALIDASLLRPRDWIAAQGLRAGGQFAFRVAELDVVAEAVIVAIKPCPPLAAGAGEAVIGRFRTRRVDRTVAVRLEGGAAFEGTPIHPVWSVDRQDWVSLEHLVIGERLQAVAGPRAIVSLVVHRRPTAVYNLEVRGEHVYQITDVAILVHNANPCAAPLEGIYRFPDQRAGGTPYVGQSGDFAARSRKHVLDGRLTPGTESFTEVPGGKTAREIAEHKLIQELTGGVPASRSDVVSNLRDPIGPNRQHLLDGE